jgi:hypothetical protein
MPAFASIQATSIPLARPAAPVGVFRYQPGGVANFESLSNVRVLTIQFREGADAGIARFRYVFDRANPPTVPNSFQDAMSVDSGLPVVVLTFDPDGTPEVLFDGFAQVPELGLASDREMVTFLAFGVAIREWDTPIAGALMRDSDDPDTVSDYETDLVTWFNPGGLPNATPEDADAVDDFGNSYPTFLDPRIVRDPDVRRLWTLPMAIRYLCYRHNSNQTYVSNPDGSLLDGLLVSDDPDAGDSESGEIEPLLAPDYPATGKAWPAVVRDLIEPHGFGMAFRLGSDDQGNPMTTLDIFQRQGSSTSSYKDLFLQPRGAALDPCQSNLSEAQLARDTSGMTNAFSVESGLVRYEASFILAPGFSISGSDGYNSSSLAAFDKNGADFAQENHDKYRLYVFDETGEGHWDWKASKTSFETPSLDDLLGTEDDPASGYVKRRRVPIGELFTLDPNQKPLRAQLSISTSYGGSQPDLWDGTGTWQPIGGGFELLKDRLGIWINVPNPNRWNIQISKVSGTPYPSGIVKGVEDQANFGAKHFALRLTCVIEGDHVIAATADRRPSSPTAYTILRHVDARDRYARHVVAANSEFNSTSDEVIVRDDTTDALAEAISRRSASEAGEVAGVVTIPRFTQAYRIGDRICSIQGRNLSLQTNAGVPTEEGEVYPAVVGLTWDFDGKQQTLLQLSDQRGQHR